MPADLVPTLVGQLDNLTIAPTIYLGLVAVVALAAVFSKSPSRRRVALDVLRVLLPRRRTSGQDEPSPPRSSPADP